MSETVFEVNSKLAVVTPNLIYLVTSCRDLPVPLLTKEYLPTFASLVEIDELKEQVRTLNLLILLLPSLHQRALKVAHMCVCPLPTSETFILLFIFLDMGGRGVGRYWHHVHVATHPHLLCTINCSIEALGIL